MTAKKKRTKWENRKRVKNCDDRTFSECNRCGGGYDCDHELSQTIDCEEDCCPWFDVEKNRWRKEPINPETIWGE